MLQRKYASNLKRETFPCALVLYGKLRKILDDLFEIDGKPKAGVDSLLKVK